MEKQLNIDLLLTHSWISLAPSFTWEYCFWDLHCHLPVHQTSSICFQLEKSCGPGEDRVVGHFWGLWASNVSTPTYWPVWSIWQKLLNYFKHQGWWCEKAVMKTASSSKLNLWDFKMVPIFLPVAHKDRCCIFRTQPCLRTQGVWCHHTQIHMQRSREECHPGQQE